MIVSVFISFLTALGTVFTSVLEQLKITSVKIKGRYFIYFCCLVNKYTALFLIIKIVLSRKNDYLCTMKYIILITCLILSINSYSRDRINGSWKYVDTINIQTDIKCRTILITLNKNGTYNQFIQIVPRNSSTYFGIRHYEIRGKWFLSKKRIFIEEYGIVKNIALEKFYSKFENILDLSNL